MSVRVWISITLAALTVLAGTAYWLLSSSSASLASFASLAEAERTYEDLISDVGGAQAYARFSHAVSDLTPARQHELAHSFGAALFAQEGKAGLSVCDGNFSYGCFHEFLGRAISSYGLSVASELNNGCIESLVDSPLSCQHGIGHGILAYMGYGTEAIRKALDECSVLPYNDPIGGCYGGAFMEYNVQTMLGTDARLRSPRNANAPYEPCNELPEKYRTSCAFWQPQWWHVAVLQGSSETAAFQQLGEYCRGMATTDALRRTCFEGIGNITAPSANFEPAKMRELCDATSSDSRDRLYCRSLAANSLSNGGAGQKGRGEEVCNGLPEEYRAYCLSYASNKANILESLESPL